MSVRNREQEAEIREALAMLGQVDMLDMERDALRVLERAALAWVGGICPRCEAQQGDNEYCVFDGSPHAWVAASA